MDELLNSSNHLNLWQHFSQEAANIKDKLWTTASWLFTLLGGVLGFIAKGLEPDALAFQEPKLTAVLAWVGLVLSAYGYWMITEYSWHIRTAWNRSEF